MTPTLNITIQRPSEETIEVLRMVETNGPHWRLDECEEWFREDPARAIKEQGELVRVWQYRMAVGEPVEFVSLTELGRLTLAAYDAEAAGDGGQVEKLKDKVIEAAREFYKWACVTTLQGPVIERVMKIGDALYAFDAATDKAGEVEC